MPFSSHCQDPIAQFLHLRKPVLHRVTRFERWTLQPKSLNPSDPKPETLHPQPALTLPGLRLKWLNLT